MKKFILGIILGILISFVLLFKIEDGYEYTSYDCRLWDKDGKNVYPPVLYCNHAWYIKIYSKFKPN